MSITPKRGHPGGEALTRRLLELAALSPCRILDMGAGDGEAVRLLRSLGYNAEGIDLVPGADVARGDFLHCPFPDESFDALISECAFYASGDAGAAMREAARLLRPDGKLLLADVFFGEFGELRLLAENAGLRVLSLADETALWREYYLSLVWAGYEETLCGLRPKGKCRYFLMIAERSL